MPRRPIEYSALSPMARSAVGVDTYVQTFPDPTAGSGFEDLAKALGFAAESAASLQKNKEKEFDNNLQYYASEFSRDKDLGLVDATQVGKAYPDASPVVHGKVTEIIGRQWANEYVRSKIDSFLSDSASRKDPSARRELFASLRSDVAKQVEGRPFFGNGALSTTEALIREYESGFQREAGEYSKAIQEEDFAHKVSEALKGSPVTAAAGETGGLLQFISEPESGGNYNAYYGNGQNTAIKFTDMSIDEVLSWQGEHVKNGSISSAVGRYQFIRSTLRELKQDLRLGGSEKFTPELQDELANHLLKKRGLDDYRSGRLSKEDFANNLAKEWASLPLVSGSRAGESFYEGDRAGNSSGVDVHSFMDALDNMDRVIDPVSFLDNAAGFSSSLDPIRRRELVITSAIDTALASRDTSIFDRVPSNMRGMPDVEARISKAKNQIRDLSWSDYTRRNQAETIEKERKEADLRQEILDKIANGEDVNPVEYSKHGDNVFSFALRMKDADLVSTVDSSARAAIIRDTYLKAATVGGQLLSPNGEKMDQAALIKSIQEAPGLTVQDKKKLLEDLPKLSEGVNILSNPKVTSFYTSRIGTDVQMYLNSISGTLDKMQGNTISGTIRRVFDDSLRAYVLASIEEGQDIPRGFRLIELLEKAEEKALKKLDSLSRYRSFNKPKGNVPTGKAEEKKQEATPSAGSDEEILKRYLNEE